ncbi:hypothetical protein DEJ28_08680 [Curtobacterium sp. MCPF17_002]|uniref:hypothetical protein n=1 Tax=Curtobacterium sp. MCPF17_002 TaxID=2175645 RepID=UPI000DAA2B9B|nr:hypothetical protein [Curtobacterium sp. MCPF17_002]WIB79159.1 hypothetical protein DEJ28_08680 [Curtobacterium sp. MCPF17_002]
MIPTVVFAVAYPVRPCSRKTLARDVASTLAELLHERSIARRILEVTAGETPIAEAVRDTIRG